MKGTLFWCFLYPRTIQSLRHVWTHPDFPEEVSQQRPIKSTKEESEAWLRAWCADGKNDAPPYEDLIWTANRNDDPEYLSFGTDCHGEIPSEVWDHLERVIGLPLTRAKYFSCAC